MGMVKFSTIIDVCILFVPDLKHCLIKNRIMFTNLWYMKDKKTIKIAIP